MNRSTHGMTLIEVLIALSILAVAITGVLGQIPATAKLISDSNEYEIARHAAGTKIAEIRAAGLAAAPLFDQTFFEVGDLTRITDAAECGSVTVENGPDGTQEVRVFVVWRGMYGRNKQLEFSTLVGQ